jgi:predicted RNase H-like HicB family nuclease
MNKLNISLPIIVELDEDNIFIVSCPVFKACHSYGKTIDEAINNLKEVIEMCLEESDYIIDTHNKYIELREINITIPINSELEYA